jgi:hypothetical protein
VVPTVPVMLSVASVPATVTATVTPSDTTLRVFALPSSTPLALICNGLGAEMVAEPAESWSANTSPRTSAT